MAVIMAVTSVAHCVRDKGEDATLYKMMKLYMYVQKTTTI